MGDPLDLDGLEVPGRLGDFRLLRRLGEGRAGVVYLARQGALERRVALRLIRPELLELDGARQRLAREVEAAARLAHPGIAAVYQLGEERGLPFLATEHVRGASLERVIELLHGRNPVSLTGNDLLRVVAGEVDLRPDADVAQRPPFDGSWSAACLWIAREAAQALEHAHQRGVLHRGMRPSSVMLTPEGRVLLIDLGLASLAGEAGGDPAGLAPEQLEGREDQLGPATDVYGLGATLYRLLALRAPERGEGSDPAALRRAILAGSMPRLRAVCPAASADTAAVVARAMERDPARRYPGAADLARDLTRLLDQQPVEARDPGAWLQLTRWIRAHRAAAAALGLLLAGAVGGPLLFGYRQHALGERRRAEHDRAERARTTAERERARADEQLAGAERERDAAELRRGRAEALRTEAEARRALAEGHLERALEALEGMLRRVSEGRLAEVPWLEELRRALATDARRLLAELERTAGADGASIRWRRGALGVALAELERLLGDVDAARALLEYQVAELRALAAGAGQPDHRADLALALARLAAIELDRTGAERALELTGEALELLEEGLVVGTVDGRVWFDLLGVRTTAFERLDRGAEALRAADRLLEVARRQLDRAPGDPEARRVLAVALGERGRLVLGRDPAQAAADVERGLDELRALLARHPSEVPVRRDLCALAATLSSALAALERHEAALEAAAEGVAVAASLVRDFPADARYRLQLESLRVQLGLEAASLGRVDRAVEALTAAAAGLDQLAALEPGLATPALAIPGLATELARLWVRGMEGLAQDPALGESGLPEVFERGALGALAAAVEAGAVDPAGLCADPAWEPLRGSPGFRALAGDPPPPDAPGED